MPFCRATYKEALCRKPTQAEETWQSGRRSEPACSQTCTFNRGKHWCELKTTLDIPLKQMKIAFPGGYNIEKNLKEKLIRQSYSGNYKELPCGIAVVHKRHENRTMTIMACEKTFEKETGNGVSPPYILLFLVNKNQTPGWHTLRRVVRKHLPMTPAVQQ